MTGDLAEAIARAARELPAGQALRLADEAARCSGAAEAVRANLHYLVPTAAFERVTRRLVEAWQESSGQAVALGLRAAVRAVAAARADQTIDIVWTGPQTPEVPVRLTRAVLVDVIRSAAERLVIVSFAAYKVALVINELAAAADRGIDVRLILETSEASGGRLDVDAANAFTSLGAAVSFWVWPTDQRPALPTGTAALHAKVAIADDHTALVTSANLTGHGMNENMELGLLVRGGAVPRRLAAHFAQLMTDRVLVQVPLK
jgi:phosphatidylserine/phosphatidylglycerophosphate/cardiolipin synthase-like enzyme